MSRARRWAAGGVVVVALVAPLVTGSAESPAAGATAAQLLPPRARVEELPLGGGGFVRGLRAEVGDDAIVVWSASGPRTVPGLRAAGPIVTRRMWLGTDQHGRDVLARMAHGARTSVLVAALATLTAVLCGTGAGLAAALAPGPCGRAVRLAEDALLGLPRLLLLLILGVALRGSVGGIALAIGLASWMEVARLVEGEARTLRQRPFVQAMLAAGAGRVRVGVRHLLPNLAPVLAVAAPLVAAEAILLEATLAFLGVDAGGGVGSWGRIVADGQRLLPVGWWLVVTPGIAVSALALTIHRLGRDAAGASD